MYARVVQFQLKPEAFDRGVEAFRERILGDVRQEAGFQGSQMLLERQTGRAAVISLFDVADAAQLRDEAAFRRRAGMLEGLLASEPQRAFYEVVLHDERGGARYARASQGRVVPGVQDDPGQVREMAEAAARQSGYAGFLLLADRATRDVLGISYWASPEALEASEGGYYREGMAQRASSFEGAPTRTVYEVAAQG